MEAGEMSFVYRAHHPSRGPTSCTFVFLYSPRNVQMHIFDTNTYFPGYFWIAKNGVCLFSYGYKNSKCNL